MDGAVRDSVLGRLGDGGGTPTEGLRATGGGALEGFFWAWGGGRCSEMLRSSATRFRWRSAWASGDTGLSSCSFGALGEDEAGLGGRRLWRPWLCLGYSSGQSTRRTLTGSQARGLESDGSMEPRGGSSHWAGAPRQGSSQRLLRGR